MAARREALLKGLLWAILVSAADAAAETMSLKVAAYHHIEFDGIKATRYVEEEGALRADVDRSASFLLMPFDRVRDVKHLRFEWRSEGALAVRSSLEQRLKEGDDARLRIGLIVAGDPPWIPFFAPAWIKAIRDKMKLSPGSLHFVLAGTPMSAGAKWPSPYGGRLNS